MRGEGVGELRGRKRDNVERQGKSGTAITFKGVVTGELLMLHGGLKISSSI